MNRRTLFAALLLPVIKRLRDPDPPPPVLAFDPRYNTIELRFYKEVYKEDIKVLNKGNFALLMQCEDDVNRFYRGEGLQCKSLS